jgi:hypothetical protein
MKQPTQFIALKGIEYPFALNLNALRVFSKKHNIKKPSEIGKFFSKFDMNDPDWDTLEVLADLVCSALDEGARLNEDENHLTSDDICLVFQYDPDSLKVIFDDFADKMTVEDMGKSKPKKSKKATA